MATPHFLSCETPLPHFETVARSHVGRKRKVNEDAVLSRPDLGLWAVADGMGGHDAGEVASALVVESLSGSRPAGSLEARLADVGARLQVANGRLFEAGAGGPRRRTIGSTVVALVTHGSAFACVWAGDSRAYLARDGALVRLSRDHSLVQHLVDLGEIDPADAAGHPNANVITRAVGVAETLELDAETGEARAGDVFLLASDGLTRLVSDRELLDALGGGDLEAAGDGFIDLCLRRGAPDNVSLVIVRVAAA